MIHSEPRLHTGGGAALQPDWDRAYAEQLPRVYSYFRGLVRTLEEAEQHTTRAFELAWRVRRHYRRDQVGFEARLLAIAHELGQAAAGSEPGSMFTAPRDPPAAFAARLRAQLQALELAQHWRAKRLRLHGVLSAVLLAAFCVLAVPPIRGSVQQLLQQATAWRTLWNSAAATLHAGPSKAGDALAPAFEAHFPEADELWPQQRVHNAAFGIQGGIQGGIQAGTTVHTLQGNAERPASMSGAGGGSQRSLQAVPAGLVRFAGSELGLLLFSGKMAGLSVAQNEAFKRFCGGGLDIVVTSRPIPRAEVSKCAAAGIEFIELPVAYAGVAVLVNHANVWADPLSAATLLSVLGDSQTAPVKRWNQLSVYWPDAPVSVYSLREGRGLNEYFDELLAEKSPSLTSADIGVRREADLLNVVREDPHAIAVLPLGYYLEHATRLPSMTKVARVFGWFNSVVRPDPQTIRSRYYVPLSRVLLLYVNADSARRPAVAGFVTDVLEHGAALAGEPIFAALELDDYRRALQKFQMMQRGSAFPAEVTDGLTVREILQGWPNPRPD
jgi:phosphate transport system substrate-binding protein